MEKPDLESVKPLVPFVAAIIAFFVTKKFMAAAPAKVALPEGK